MAVVWSVVYVCMGGVIGFFIPYLWEVVRKGALPTVGTLVKSQEAWGYAAIDAFLWLSCLWFMPFSLSAVSAAIGSVLLLLSVCDLEEKLLPDGLLALLLIFAVIFVAIYPASLSNRVWGVAIFGGGFGLLYLIGRIFPGQETVGSGDVFLMAVLGLILGMGGCFWAFILSVLLGAVYAIGAWAAAKITGKPSENEWAFAPFISFGGLVILIFADEILQLVTGWILSYFV